MRHAGAVDSFLLRAVVDAAVDAIIVIDEQGIVQLANAATQRRFSNSADGCIGADILMPLRNHIDTGKRKIIGISRHRRWSGM